MALALRSRSTGKGSALAVTEEAGADGWQIIAEGWSAAAVAGEVFGTVVVDGEAAMLGTALLLLLLTVLAMLVLVAVIVGTVAVPVDVGDDC